MTDEEASQSKGVVGQWIARIWVIDDDSKQWRVLATQSQTGDTAQDALALTIGSWVSKMTSRWRVTIHNPGAGDLDYVATWTSLDRPMPSLRVLSGNDTSSHHWHGVAGRPPRPGDHEAPASWERPSPEIRAALHEWLDKQLDNAGTGMTTQSVQTFLENYSGRWECVHDDQSELAGAAWDLIEMARIAQTHTETRHEDSLWMNWSCGRLMLAQAAARYIRLYSKVHREGQ